MQYGGNVLAVGGNDVCRSGKPKYGGIVSAVMQCGGKFLAVGVFSFFGGNDYGGSGNQSM